MTAVLPIDATDELLVQCARRVGEPADRWCEPADRTGLAQSMVESVLAAYIDHTLLRADATPADIAQLCEEAQRHGFATVCIPSSYVAQAQSMLAGTSVGICTVVGFPLGNVASETKGFETRQAVSQGASEIDMVIHLGWLRAGEDDRVRGDIRQVVEAAGTALVKVILETASLSTEEKVRGALLAKQAGARFVKTSTGFGKGGATLQDVALLHRVVGHTMAVKASGGIRTRDDAERMILAGADRIGASASVAIVTAQPASAGGGY